MTAALKLSPNVSVVTVVLNAESTIERTILSVIGQTYNNIEYLVIDGDSGDRTVELIKKYDRHIDYWASEPDNGHFDAMNKGAAAASGDYLLFMNAGDCFEQPDSLDKALRGSNSADLVYGRAVYVDRRGNQRRWHKDTPLPHELSDRSFLNGMVICHQCMIVRREIAPAYNLAWTISSDIDWAIRLMRTIETKHFYDGTFCLYLDEGISNDNRITSVIQRFQICGQYFGWVRTIAEQFRMLWRCCKRLSIS